MTQISDKQRDQLVGAAIRHLAIADESARLTIIAAFLGGATDPNELYSLLKVFGAMQDAVVAELKIMTFENRGSPEVSAERH